MFSFCPGQWTVARTRLLPMRHLLNGGHDKTRLCARQPYNLVVSNLHSLPPLGLLLPFSLIPITVCLSSAAHPYFTRFYFTSFHCELILTSFNLLHINHLLHIINIIMAVSKFTCKSILLDHQGLQNLIILQATTFSLTAFAPLASSASCSSSPAQSLCSLTMSGLSTSSTTTRAPQTVPP